jgi:antitoxin (DNA-binding transcriptional repressor) of toxin-antitoxin stability system
LSHYGRRCREEPVVVTVNGVPSFQLAPLSEDDDLIDSLLEHNPAFRQTLRARLKEKSISIKEARRRL